MNKMHKLVGWKANNLMLELHYKELDVLFKTHIHKWFLTIILLFIVENIPWNIYIVFKTVLLIYPDLIPFAVFTF